MIVVAEAPSVAVADQAFDRAVADLAVAVLIPCLNEAASIARVVAAFRAALPHAIVYVYDNASTDGTGDVARRAGAIVRVETLPGKGNVVRRMFADVDADLYVLADGDGTYDAAAAPAMIRRLAVDRLDMVVGTRNDVYDRSSTRFGHGLGNALFNRFYRSLFGPRFTDIFSGYRVFSRRFVKSFPANASGFEVETEMSVQASQLRLPIAEMPTNYGTRVAGSASKLASGPDALRILWMHLMLFKEIHPIRFFGSIATVLSFAALILAEPLFSEFARTGLVPRQPTAILATGLVLLAAIALLAGLILDSVAAGRLEQKRLAYLRLPGLDLPDVER